MAVDAVAFHYADDFLQKSGRSRNRKSVNCQVAVRKNILIFRMRKSVHIHCCPVPLEGRLAIVTDAGRDAVDADGALTNAPDSGRRSRVVLTPRRWCQVGGSNFAGDGGKKARSPGRARRKPLKPLRGECRVISGVTVVTLLAWLVFLPCQAAGALGARHSLRPLFRGQGNFQQNSDASRRENAKL